MTLIKADSDAKDKSGILCDNIKKMLTPQGDHSSLFPLASYLWKQIERHFTCPDLLILLYTDGFTKCFYIFIYFTGLYGS